MTTGAYHVRYSTTAGLDEITTFSASTGYLQFSTTSNITSSPIIGTVDSLFKSTNTGAGGTPSSTNNPGYSLTNCGTLGTTRQLNNYVTFASVSASPLAAFALTAEMTLLYNFLVSNDSPDTVTNYRINTNRTIDYSVDLGVTYLPTGSTISYNTIAGAASNLGQTGAFIFGGSVNCFLEGTKLYAHVHDKDLYVNIEDLREGDLINTYLHGKKAIKFIGKDTLFNNPDKWNECLKKIPKSGDMIDDLFITGAHSLLVDELSEKESDGIMAIYGTTDRKIDDKFMLNAWVSENAEPVLAADFFTVYHLVLEHDDDEDKKYGIWANGVLTESQCEKHFLGKDYELL